MALALDTSSRRRKAAACGVAALAVLAAAAGLGPGFPGQDGPAQVNAVPADCAPTDTAGPAPMTFPSASTTGVPAGTVLKPSHGTTLKKAGAVVEGLDITGTVTITASDVTLRRSRVSDSAYVLIQIDKNATGVVISDVEIDGRGPAGLANSMGVSGPATVIRTNIHGVENGIAAGSGSLIKDSYIHDLAAPGDAHYDGIQIDGDVADITVDHNLIDLHGLDQTSAIMIDNYYGAISNVDVTRNRMLGGAYTMYSDGQFGDGPITCVSFDSNRLGKGHWGHATVRLSTVTWRGNVDDATEEPVTG